MQNMHLPRLRERRLAADLTIAQLGERAEVSPAHICRLEHLERRASIGAAFQLATALGVTPAALQAEQVDR